MTNDVARPALHSDRLHGVGSPGAVTSQIDLPTLVADPSRLSSVPLDELPSVIGRLEELRALVWAELITRSASATGSSPPAPTMPLEDRLLPVREAAELLGVDSRWMYRHADRLPFARKIGANTLRFSSAGLLRWAESQR